VTAIDALRCAVEGEGGERVLTLDAAFGGLPDTAHGGSVLAVFDAVAARTGPRELAGHYLKRVPPATPLRLRVEPAGDACRLELFDDRTILVSGSVRGPHSAREATSPAAPGATSSAPTDATPPAEDAMALPISSGCFACGVDNPMGLGVRLRADAVAVGGTWMPRPGFRQADGTLSPVALTTMLDEAAFWLGALATGESGMTTELRVTLHAPAPADGPITVAGRRSTVHARANDPRYWDTTVAARDAAGRLVASASITFVAVRGAARRLVTGMLAVNAPELLRRVFPTYIR
jgi:acyl-coenzyme A thioesterase PaaI-like protein